MSCYTKLGRFEGVAGDDDGNSFSVGYAHGLEEAYALIKERCPNAAYGEVVEHESDGFVDYIVHPTRYILKTKE